MTDEEKTKFIQKHLEDSAKAQAEGKEKRFPFVPGMGTLRSGFDYYGAARKIFLVEQLPSGEPLALCTNPSHSVNGSLRSECMEPECIVAHVIEE